MFDEQQFYHVTNSILFGLKKPLEVINYRSLNEELVRCNSNIRLGPPAPFEPFGQLKSTIGEMLGGESFGIYMRKEDRDNAKHHSERDFTLGEALFNLEEMLNTQRK